MKVTGCARQDEVRALLRQGHWPEAGPAEVREHVAECHGCAQLVRLTLGFARSREGAMASARMMPPGLMWWRAQLRRRQQAMEQAGRPIRAAEAFALAVSLCGVAGLGMWMVERGYWRTWEASAAAIGTTMKAYAAVVFTMPMVAAGVALMVLAGLAGWLMLEAE